MPLSVKLYALLPKPASVLDRKNQGKGAATAGELCPQKRKRTRTTQRGRDLDVDFRNKSAAVAHFWPLFLPEKKVAKEKRLTMQW